MSSMINKVKDAIRGDHDTEEDSRTDKLDMSDADRAKYGSSTHGGGERYGTSGQDTSGNQGRFMGAGEMNPQSGATDSRGSSNLPGSFPGSEHESVSRRHKDGREYVPPQGTQVGQGISQGTSRQTGYDQGTSQGTSRQTGYDQGTSQGTSHQTGYDQGISQGTTRQTGYDRAEQAVTGRDKSDQYDQTSSSRGNVDERGLMDPASHDSHSNIMGGAAGGAAGAGAGAAAYESSSGHNKLHKRDDPRGDVYSSQHGSKHHGSHGTHDTHDMHGKHGTHRETVGGTPYERQGAEGYADDTTGRHHGHHGHHSGQTAGAGGLATSQIPERRHHGDTGREAYAGSNEGYRQGDTSGAGSHLSSAPQGRSHGDDSRGAGGVYNTVIGHGSNREHEREGTSGLSRSSDQTYGSGQGMTSGSGGNLREDSDSRLGSGTTALGAGAAGAGAAGLASRHHNKERDQDYGRGSEHGYGSSSSQRDPTSTSYGATSNQPGATSNYGTSGQPTTSSSQPGGMFSSAQGGMPGAASATNGGSQFGPGHSGPKVMHKCSGCGHDNDISHHFKDKVFRISQ